MSTINESVNKIRLFLTQQGIATNGVSVILGNKEVPAAVTRGELVATLDTAIKYQRKLVVVPIAITIAMFIVSSVLVFTFRTEPKVLAGVFAGSGISMTLPIWWLTHTLRQLWFFEVSVAVIPSLDGKALATHLQKLMVIFRMSAMK